MKQLQSILAATETEEGGKLSELLMKFVMCSCVLDRDDIVTTGVESYVMCGYAWIPAQVIVVRALNERFFAGDEPWSRISRTRINANTCQCSDQHQESPVIVRLEKNVESYGL